MGNTASRKASVSAKSFEKESPTATMEESPTMSRITYVLDAKTPAIPQTPLTQTIANHLNLIGNDDANQNQNIRTPSYLLRKKILYDLGYTYSIRDNDPRSPSHCIPRTPMSLTETTDTVEASSFQYNSTLEDSCRDFNEKLDNMIMEEPEAGGKCTKMEIEDGKTDGSETQEIICSKKTSDCDSENTPNFEAHTNDNSHINVANNGNATESHSKTTEGNMVSLENTFSTPVLNTANRAGRIPLSVINRRGLSTEVTPRQPTIKSHNLSIEKYSKNHSFNSLDENRSSARKSKIPVYKK